MRIAIERRGIRCAMAALLATALMLGATVAPASAYPPEDAGYLDYAEMVAAVQAIAARNPQIAEQFSIGRSFEGRELWAAKVSVKAWTDPETWAARVKCR